MRITLLSLFFLGLLAFSACKKDEDPEPEPVIPDPCEEVSASFSNDIEPIFAASCALSGCHDSVTQEEGKNFEGYDNIVASIEDDQEQFLMSINFEGGSTGWMPRNDAEENATEEDKLPAADIEKIECWIANGMPNN